MVIIGISVFGAALLRAIDLAVQSPRPDNNRERIIADIHQ